MGRPVSYGGISFEALAFQLQTYQQLLPGIRTGGLDRTARQGVQAYVIGDFSGGHRPRPDIAVFQDAANTYLANQGLQTRPPLTAPILPYGVTNQSALAAIDISGYVAANLRIHAILSSLATTGLRWYGFLGPNMYRDTSLTNSALIAPTTDNIAENVLGVSEGLWNNTRYLWLWENDVAIKGTTSPIDAAITWVTLVTLSASDWGFGVSMPRLGPGGHVLLGTVAGVNGHHWVPSSAAVPVATTPIVLSTGSTTPNPNGTPVTLTHTPAADELFQNSNPGDAEAWAQLSDALVNNGVRAQNAFTAGNETNYLCVRVGDTFNGRLATGTIITGLSVTVECQESAADDNVVFSRVAIWSTPSLTAAPDVLTIYGGDVNPYIASPGELNTSDQSEVAALDSLAVAQLTSAIVAGSSSVVGFNFIDNAGTTPQVNVDNISAITLTFIPPGTPPTIVNGGHSISPYPDPVDPTSIVAIVPRSTDTALITQPRELNRYTYLWDSSRQAPVVTIETLNTGAPYVWDAAYFLGGVVFTGNNIAGPGRFLRHVASDGSLRDYGFEAYDMDKECRINAIHPVGDALLLEVLYYNAAGAVVDLRHVMWIDGRFYTDTILQSLTSLAVAAAAIPWAEKTLNLNQAQVYSIFPSPSPGFANTAVRRQFIPHDLRTDPRLVSASELKMEADADNNGTEDAALWLRLPEFALSPVEAQQTLLVVQAQTRRIDDATTYGAALLQAMTDGSTSFGSPSLDLTFNSALQSQNVPSGGLAYKTLVLRVGATHQLASAETPDVGPFVLTTAQAFEQVLYLTIYADPRTLEGGRVTDFLSRMATLVNTKLANTLQFGSESYLAIYEGLASPSSAPLPPPLGGQLTAREFMTERRTRGGEVEADVIPVPLQFRIVPGAAA